MGDDGDTKTCPYCAETIKAAAIVCRYCGRDLPRAGRCPRCSAPIEGDPWSCPHCHTTLRFWQDMAALGQEAAASRKGAPAPAENALRLPSGSVCPHCGKACDPKAAICLHCGRAIDWDRSRLPDAPRGRHRTRSPVAAIVAIVVAVPLWCIIIPLLTRGNGDSSGATRAVHTTSAERTSVAASRTATATVAPGTGTARALGATATAQARPTVSYRATQTATYAPTRTPRRTATPVYGLSRSLPVPLRRWVTASDRSEIAVVDLTRPANEEVARSNMFNPKPGAGEEWVLVAVAYGCGKASGSTCAFGSYEFRLVGSRGVIYEQPWVVLPDGVDPSQEVFSGAQDIVVLMPFLISKEERDLVLIWDPGWSRDAIYMQVARSSDVATPTTPAEASSPASTYTIQAGDTLSAIAEAHGVTLEELMEANGIEDPDSLPVGQVLKVP